MPLNLKIIRSSAAAQTSIERLKRMLFWAPTEKTRAPERAAAATGRAPTLGQSGYGNLCGEVYTAPAPEGGEEKYDASALGMVGMLKYRHQRIVGAQSVWISVRPSGPDSGNRRLLYST